MRGLVAYIVIVGEFGISFCRERSVSTAKCLTWKTENDLARSDS